MRRYFIWEEHQQPLISGTFPFLRGEREREIGHWLLICRSYSTLQLSKMPKWEIQRLHRRGVSSAKQAALKPPNTILRSEMSHWHTHRFYLSLQWEPTVYGKHITFSLNLLCVLQNVFLRISAVKMSYSYSMRVLLPMYWSLVVHQESMRKSRHFLLRIL